MRWIYNLGIHVFDLGLSIAGLFNAKINEWNKQRNQDFNHIDNIIKKAEGKPIIWMHCASLGEYEQGIIVLKKLKDRSPNQYFLLLSFFSPSGYIQKKSNLISDAVIYLPCDTPSKMDSLVSKIQPTYFIGVKYEFWWNLLNALSASKCNIIYISLILRENHYLYSYFGKKYLNQLKAFNHIFTQDDATYDKLLNLGFCNLHRSSDTRISSVAERKQHVKPLDKFAFLSDIKKQVIVYGSIYKSDLPAIAALINDSSYYHIVVPHHINAENVLAIQKKLDVKLGLYTQLGDQVPDYYRHGIIINTIGKLFDIYQYASFVYVGGGFEKGIHNTLEPAVFNVPLAFGPLYKKFPEAHYFIENGCAKSITTNAELEQFVKATINNPKIKDHICEVNVALFDDDDTVNEILNEIE